ncbi:unnamed protein product [Paramecium sonneborni]|uniref:Uncharacterized protein n=1 Tax=Paramecium sonneborni TaxID=65129 RepID=A0A8S1Q379_9CILI|nr:unnamed protein product [Paramecium sonneborni]
MQKNNHLDELKFHKELTIQASSFVIKYLVNSFIKELSRNFHLKDGKILKRNQNYDENKEEKIGIQQNYMKILINALKVLLKELIDLERNLVIGQLSNYGNYVEESGLKNGRASYDQELHDNFWMKYYNQQLLGDLKLNIQDNTRRGNNVDHGTLYLEDILNLQKMLNLYQQWRRKI